MRVLSLGMVAGLCFVGSAAAQVNMELVGTNSSYNMGGVYTSPYQLSIGGVTTWAICDDFLTDIGMYSTWQAEAYTLSDVTSTGPQKMTTSDTTPDWSLSSISSDLTALGAAGVGSDTYEYTIPEEYDAAAILAEELMANMSNQLLSGEYSFAIWTIFDPGAINGYGGNALTTSEQEAVYNFMASALNEAHTGGGPSNLSLTIYTPKPLSASQEFLVVSAPDASLAGTLAVSLSTLAGLMFFLRRRLVRA